MSRKVIVPVAFGSIEDACRYLGMTRSNVMLLALREDVVRAAVFTPFSQAPQIAKKHSSKKAPATTKKGDGRFKPFTYGDFTYMSRAAASRALKMPYTEILKLAKS